ncbi:carbamate kinase [Anaerosporobacter mobilis DSM 15930]|uniref:Carbamate kinase n=1 Tax=Anaerosporobacter mobilis DSM 15930 TaxID=1120996 RepID=A0A1M7MTZ7_9FIRM|nr:carbamate kinase [Anaerosporobacter mobilis]SHM94593.1 carbamate kinase [Anaerosporobacter mobilis DSM 15930]
MQNKKVVVALGHSAFGKTFPEQQESIKNAAVAIADLVEAKYQVVITHSNAPQVGMIHTAMTEYSRLDKEQTVAPMSICSAMSQGYIGYDLQNAIRTELLQRGIYKTVSTIITQVRVDTFDPAFHNPTKVIGRIMSEEEAKEEEQKGNYVIPVADGFRRIIAAPKPIDIYEIDAIRALLDAGQVVIACGGGGIPVLEQGTKLKGASAVIEKDLVSAKMAELLNADTLLLLTGVDRVFLNFGSDNETPLETVTLEEAKNYMNEGHFAAGSMQPKVEAAIKFVSTNPEHTAIISHLDKARSAIKGKTGTHFVK